MHLAFKSVCRRRRTASAPPARVQVAHPRRRRQRQQPMSPHTTRNPTIPTAAQIRMFVIAHLVSPLSFGTPWRPGHPAESAPRIAPAFAARFARGIFSSRRRTVCTIPVSLYVGETTKSRSCRVAHPYVSFLYAFLAEVALRIEASRSGIISAPSFAAANVRRPASLREAPDQ